MALIDTPGMNSDRDSDAMTDEKLFVLLVVGVGLLLVFAMLAWHLVKRFGYRCHWCDGRVLDLERLPNQDQRQILQYLEQYHDSNPDPKSIHVCMSGQRERSQIRFCSAIVPLRERSLREREDS